ncbi:hypothetical protein ACFLYE_04815, partial [Chloroflexota bacterium]
VMLVAIPHLPRPAQNAIFGLGGLLLLFIACIFTPFFHSLRSVKFLAGLPHMAERYVEGREGKEVAKYLIDIQATPGVYTKYSASKLTILFWETYHILESTIDRNRKEVKEAERLLRKLDKLALSKHINLSVA